MRTKMHENDFSKKLPKRTKMRTKIPLRGFRAFRAGLHEIDARKCTKVFWGSPFQDPLIPDEPKELAAANLFTIDDLALYRRLERARLKAWRTAWADFFSSSSPSM